MGRKRERESGCVDERETEGWTESEGARAERERERERVRGGKTERRREGKRYRRNESKGFIFVPVSQGAMTSLSFLSKLCPAAKGTTLNALLQTHRSNQKQQQQRS